MADPRSPIPEYGEADAGATQPPAATAAEASVEGTDERVAMVERHLPLARSIAAKLYASRFDRGAEFADFLQLAVVGLIESVDRFDTGRGVPFEAFASARIRGAVLNGVEQLSERSEQIALRARVRKERRESLIEGRAAAKGESVFEELTDIAVGLALGYMLEGSGMVAQEEGSYPSDAYRSRELAQFRQGLEATVDLLPERHRVVIKQHYFFQIPFDDIARYLGVTRARVSQIHRDALRQMRALIRAASEGEWCL